MATGGGPARSQAGFHCSELSWRNAEPMPGSAPEAAVWIVVEHPAGWGDAHLARAAHGVRVVMARGPRSSRGAEDLPPQPVGDTRVWVAHLDAVPHVRVGTVPDPGAVARWDLAAVAEGSLRTWGSPDPDPLLLVCANGRRDRCCGHLGGRLAESLWRGPARPRVLTCTHLGGHRFAPTAVLLPTGAVHGRLDQDAANDVVTGAREGWAPTGSLRGFSGLSAPAQVAEVQARFVTGHRGAGPLSVHLVAQPDPRRLLAQVSVPGSPGGPDGIAVPLRLVDVPAVLSCGRAVEHTQRWVVA